MAGSFRSTFGSVSMGWSSQPHPFERSPGRRLRRSLLVGAFIALFLGIFQPFGLSTYPATWSLALGYGLVTFLAMSLIDLAILYTGVDPERWTLARELLVSALNILLIGVLNSVYSTLVGLAAFTWWNILLFTLYTFSIGIFPVTVIVLMNFQRSKVRFAKESGEINEVMLETAVKIEHPAQQVVLFGENQKERLHLMADRLYYLKAADNYVEVYHAAAAPIERSVLRGMLRTFEDQLKELPQFLRCHKSYIVNLDLVERVSGNAQGLRLHLAGGAGEVPVSRGLTAVVRERLTVHPGNDNRSPRSLPVHPKS